MGLSGLRRFLYYPERLPVDMPPPRYAAGAREVWLDTADGERMHALYWPAPVDRPTLLFLHGNAGNVYGWAAIRGELEALDAGLLLLDYRGYGKSTGAPSEEGLVLDARAALEWLEAAGVPAARVIVTGKSLGGGVATALALERTFMGLVLESTFTSIPAVASKLFPFLPVGQLMPDRYPSSERVARAGCPVFVIHGDRDELIPLSEGEALFEAAAEPKALWRVPGAGHNDVSWRAGPEYGRRLREWMDGLD
jgi:uncharacterized protein